jgi:hypothetical protein
MSPQQVFEVTGAKRLTVTTTSDGWKVCEENDGRTVRTAICTDWHRVERTIAMFARLDLTDWGYVTNL